MKKFLLPTIGLLASLLTAQAQTYFPTNLVVVQQTTFPTSGQGVTLVQLQTNGTQVSSTALPSSGGNAFILSTSTAEGFITITANSNAMVLAGYNASAGSGSPLSATSTTDPRAVVTVDAYNNYSMPIKNPNIFSMAGCRGAVGDGLGNFWVSGSGGTGATLANGEIGVVYVGTAATSPVNYCVTVTGTGNERCLEIYNGSLYLDTGSVTHGVFVISNVSGYYPETTVSPATTNSGSTNIMLQGSGSGPYAFQINAAGTLAYVAEDNLSGVIQYTNNGSGWVSNYTLSVLTAGAGAAFTNAYGCAVDWTQNPPVIYATTSETSQNRLVRIVDTGANATPTLIAMAPNATTVWRGVRFGPQAYAYISVPPVPFAGPPGSTATFSATVLGSPAPTMQWYSNSPAHPTYVAIPGATSTNLILPNINGNQNGSLFYLFVTNVYGSYSNTPVLLTVENPVITAEPVGATNFPGSGPVTICVTANGNPTPTYQWYSNNSLISGATMACYTVPNSTGISSGSYTVTVSNSVSVVTSTPPAIVSFSPYLLNEPFNYTNGNLFSVTGSPWTDINGSNPELVINGRAQIAVTNATTDAQSKYTQPVNNTIVWASFTLNVSALPSNIGGVYFANFEDTNFGFYGRIFLLTSNNPSLTPGMPNIAYPGTYRLGIANAQNDSASTSITGPTAVVELDMAPGIDYQVVELYDMANGFCQMSVNPSKSEAAAMYYPNGPNALTSGYAQDIFTQSGLPMDAFGLRQRTGGGIMQVDNLEVSYDYNGTFSGFTAVTAASTPALAVIGYLTPSFTNYTGNNNILEVAASGIDLTYKWYQNNVPLSDGGSVSGSSTPALTLSPEVATNAGTYTVVITDAAGSVSNSVVVGIIATPTAPSFTLPGGLQPAASTTIPEGSSVTLTSTAVGTGPISYLWYFNNGSGNVSTGVTTPNLTLTGTLQSQAGTYTVVATGGVAPPATSANAVLIVTGPVSTNIHYLRSLISPSTFVVSDTTTLYKIQGTVINETNLTSGNTASYYIQDSTGGINLFITGDSTFRPAIGSVLIATGVLSAYLDNLELDVTSNNTAQLYSNTGVILPLPAPALLSWDTAVGNPSSTVPTIEGSLVTMTNVYFTTPGTFVNGTTIYPITNNTGEAFSTFLSAQDTNFDGLPIPAFAYSVTGVIEQTSATAYNLILSSYSDIVTNALPATNLTAKAVAGCINLAWKAVPFNYTYSVFAATNVAGPYTNLVSGLWFTNTSGTYSDCGVSSAEKFYKIVSP